jgi:protein farnesyltransferase subunit beta
MQNDRKNDNNKNRTFREQSYVEKEIDKIFKMSEFDIGNPDKYDKDIEYEREKHFNFAKKMIYRLPGGYSQLDAGMPWFSYWVLNILDMCSDKKIELSYANKIKFVNYLKELQHEDGGFSGYAKGIPHIVSNYAAIMAIIALDMKEGYEIVDRQKMKSFLKRMKNNNISNRDKSQGYIIDKTGNFVIDTNSHNKCTKFITNTPGSFQMHNNGESDLRATYCGLTVAYILNILDEELIEGVVDNIKLCQTFEGGLGPEPFCEAHGGYSYCGIATLALLNKLDAIDVERFILWLVNRQMKVEGGFQGRTNKLVDSCYSFWQASVFNLLILNGNEAKYSYDNELLYDQLALQAYILFACQINEGGLVDKPGKSADLFHTNYATAGLALSRKSLLKDPDNNEYDVTLTYNESVEFDQINPIFCVSDEKVKKVTNYYWNLK